tara:strand:+ start:93 stop:428 length:336 start_codon:yes stop_codon:yes gene_type:complete
MAAIAITTMFNEPGYLMWPQLYVAAGFAGAISSVYAIVSPSKWALALSGAFIAGGITARGIGLVMTALVEPWRGDISWTFIVAGLAYFVILTMLPPLWFKYLIPWAVEKVQ